MNKPAIHVFRHEAMATEFQVRIADEEQPYAEQAAAAAFVLLDRLEGMLSRFRETSEISQLALLRPGETLRLSEPAFACLKIAQKMETATGGAFAVAAAALQTQAELPQCALIPERFSAHCLRGRLEFDLGAIGKGFALDRMARLLGEWSCPAHLLVAGGSSILAGAAPAGLPGWSCGLGEDDSPVRYWLTQVSVGGSGLAVKGEHILNPRTGRAAQRTRRAWALADTAAEADALSTAAMVLDTAELDAVLSPEPSWLVILDEPAGLVYQGARPLPPPVVG